jgi:hypothetical protein
MQHPNSQKSTIHMRHMTKFSIIISQGGNASHKEEYNNITKIHVQGGMQAFMDKEECKSFLVAIHNLSLHSIISIKLSFGCDHLIHEEIGNSFMNICQQ